VHAFPEALIAESLAQAGHEIVYVTCGRGLQEHCVPMSAYGVRIEAGAQAKARVCERCEQTAGLLRERFGLRGCDLADLLQDEDRAEAGRIAAAATPQTFLDIRLDGVEIGRTALGTFLLQYKKISFEFTPPEWRAFRAELHNTLLSFFAGRRLLDRERPDRLIMYSSGYSVNLAVSRLAAARGIVQFYMNAGANLTDRLQKVVLARGSSLQRRLLAYWPQYRDVPCPPGVMRYITDHYIELLRGRAAFVYSSARNTGQEDLRARLGIPPGSKVLLATMSSYDELFAAEATGLFPSDYATPFRTQVDWVRALGEWARSRPGVFVLVRVHPREFPNKRDSVKSEHARLLEAALTGLPANCRVNWPSDGLSLYDVAEITDVCLNSWSTAGKEMSLLGIPTVIYAPDLVFYAAELNYVGTTPQTYFEAVERALADGWSVSHARAMFRWQALEDAYSRLDISDGFQRDEYHRAALPVRALQKGLRMVDPFWREKRDIRRRAARLAIQPLVARIVEEARDSVLDLRSPAEVPAVSVAQETAALRTELGRLMRALYRDPHAPARPGTLKAHLQGFVGATPASEAA
jgi:hypothetical protein